eukprot:c19240_g1_i1 orf=2-190(-)
MVNPYTHTHRSKLLLSRLLLEQVRNLYGDSTDEEALLRIKAVLNETASILFMQASICYGMLKE